MLISFIISDQSTSATVTLIPPGKVNIHCLCDSFTALVGPSIGTAVGVSVSVLFMVSSMGVLVASVLCYVSRRSKKSSHKPSSHADPATVYDEVGTNRKMKGDAMEMGTNASYGSHVSPTVYEDVGTNKKRDAMEMNANTAYGSYISCTVHEVDPNKKMDETSWR